MASMDLRPLGDQVVVQPKPQEEKTKSGIVLPESAKEKPQEGTVVAVGSGKILDGKKVPLEVKVGDKVIYAKYRGTEYDKYVILKESDILAVKGGKI